MELKKLVLTVSLFIMALQEICAADIVASPDGHIIVTTGLKGGKPYYEVKRDKESIINVSYLGFKMNNGSLKDRLKIVSKSRDSKNETWEQVWGEDKIVKNNYNELTLCLQQTIGQNLKMNIVFRVFNDGFGFRYEFPRQDNLTDFRIMEELTQVSMPVDAEAWTEPTNGTSYYEALWTKSPLSKKDTVNTPITIQVNDSLFMALHEANLTDYASLNYTPKHYSGAAVTLVAALTPWKNGVKVYARAPFNTPWRTCIIVHKPGELITSRLMLNLNEPCKIKDTSWIQTGKYVGIWWGMHMKKYTWAQGPQHGATTENTCRYIDFAARHGFKSVLVEGWNYGWDGDWTREGDKFSFTRPYPDYNLKELCAYAKERGVRIIAHNETGGAAKNYENQLDSAFALYHSLGINTIKTGYVNKILDNSELQHSQYGIRHYRKVIETAAKYHLMVINHEPAMPTGLQRTYPNLMTQEGMRGQEYNAWSTDGGNPPEHICLLPFTRGLAGPMDFTPGIFNFHNTAVPCTHPQTTLAKQLAEYIIIYSPWQMAADMIENYEDQPGLAFIESCSTNWSKTVIPNAEIGKYVTIARKDRDSEKWFVGSVTDKDARDIDISLSFLDTGVPYTAVIYQDGPGANYRDNPTSLTTMTRDVTSATVLKLHLAPSGGAAICIKKNK